MNGFQKVPTADDLFEGLEADYPDDRSRLAVVVEYLRSTGHFADARGFFKSLAEEVKDLNAAERRCVVCGAEPPTVAYCLECGGELCPTCSSQHETNPIYRCLKHQKWTSP